MRDGAILDFSVQENLFLHDHAAPKYTRGVFMDLSGMTACAKELVSRFDVKTPRLETPLPSAVPDGETEQLVTPRRSSQPVAEDGLLGNRATATA